MRRGHRPRSDERGVVLVIVALVITALFLVLAIVVDLGATRSDRRGGQLAVDNATSTAAQTFAGTEDVEAACLDALSIIESTVEGPAFTPKTATDDCALLLACTGLNSPVTFVSGEFEVSIHHPVPDGSPLMQNTSTIGNTGVTAGDDEGDPCDRIGVELTTTGDAFFGGIADQDERVSTVHAVAAVTSGTTELRPLNLLALERYDCDAMEFAGQGNAIVAAFRESNTDPWTAGIAALDSDASGVCNGRNAATLVASGGGDLTANGPCPDDPFEVCETGGILVLAPLPGSGACTGTSEVPACREDGGGTINPDVQQSSQRFTRASVDHRYNCKPSYALEPWAQPGDLDQPIDGCEESTVHTDYVDDLLDVFVPFKIANIATPGSWNVISDGDCDANGGSVTGNTIVDCGGNSNKWQPKGTWTFNDGNVIFTSDIVPQGGASVEVNACNPSCSDSIDWDHGDDFDENQSSADAAWAYIEGDLTIQNGRSATFNNTAVFFPEAGRIDQRGGNMDWTAPEDAGPFDDLAMWSEGTDVHQMRGDASISLVGTFFNGRSTFDYAGSSDQTLDDAQFVANKMKFAGTGNISLSPTPDGAVEFPVDPTWSLIR